MDAVFAMFGADELPEGMACTSSAPPWVLSIDDDVDFSDAMKCRLESHGVAVVRAYNGMEGYRWRSRNLAVRSCSITTCPTGKAITCCVV